MSKYIVITIVGFTLLGGSMGHYFRENYPPLTLTIQKYYRASYEPNSFRGRYGSSVAGGTVGFLEGVAL